MLEQLVIALASKQHEVRGVVVSRVEVDVVHNFPSRQTPTQDPGYNKTVFRDVPVVPPHRQKLDRALHVLRTHVVAVRSLVRDPASPRWIPGSRHLFQVARHTVFGPS